MCFWKIKERHEFSKGIGSLRTQPERSLGTDMNHEAQGQRLPGEAKAGKTPEGDSSLESKRKQQLYYKLEKKRKQRNKRALDGRNQLRYQGK